MRAEMTYNKERVKHFSKANHACHHRGSRRVCVVRCGRGGIAVASPCVAGMCRPITSIGSPRRDRPQFSDYLLEIEPPHHSPSPSVENRDYRHLSQNATKDLTSPYLNAGDLN